MEDHPERLSRFCNYRPHPQYSYEFPSLQTCLFSRSSTRTTQAFYPHPSRQPVATSWSPQRTTSPSSLTLRTTKASLSNLPRTSTARNGAKISSLILLSGRRIQHIPTKTVTFNTPLNSVWHAITPQIRDALRRRTIRYPGIYVTRFVTHGGGAVVNSRLCIKCSRGTSRGMDVLRLLSLAF